MGLATSQSRPDQPKRGPMSVNSRMPCGRDLGQSAPRDLSRPLNASKCVACFGASQRFGALAPRQLRTSVIASDIDAARLSGRVGSIFGTVRTVVTGDEVTGSTAPWALECGINDVPTELRSELLQYSA
jgi:hypothetical protein